MKELYADVARGAARRWPAGSVWAHLLKLAEDGKAKGDALDGEWSAV